MANEKNLVNGKKTQFSGDRAAKMGAKGGKATGKAKRENADMRSSAQAILDGKYKTTNGDERKGAEIVVLNLFQIATDKTHKKCVEAAKTLMELVGANRTAELIEHDKLENELLKTKIKAAENGVSPIDNVQIVIQPREKDNEPT